MCFISKGHREPRRSARRIRENLGAFGKVALLRVRFGHHPPKRLELLSNPFDDALVTAKLHPGRVGCSHGGQIIGSRPEPAGRDDHTMHCRKAMYQRRDSIEIVVDRRMLDDVEAELGQLFTEPGSVGVHQLTPGELGADR